MTQQQMQSSDVRIRFNSSNTVSLSQESTPQNFIQEITGEILANSTRIGEIKARCLNISGARESGLPLSQLFQNQPNQTSSNQEFQTAITELFGSQQSYSTGSQNQEGRQQQSTKSSSSSTTSKSTDLNNLEMVLCIDSIHWNDQQYRSLEPQIVKQCLRTFAMDGTYVIVNTKSQSQPQTQSATVGKSSYQQQPQSSSNPTSGDSSSGSSTAQQQWSEFGFQPLGSSSNYYGGEYAYNRVPSTSSNLGQTPSGGSASTSNPTKGTSQQAHTGTSSRSA